MSRDACPTVPQEGKQPLPGSRSEDHLTPVLVKPEQVLRSGPLLLIPDDEVSGLSAEGLPFNLLLPSLLFFSLERALEVV